MRRHDISQVRRNRKRVFEDMTNAKDAGSGAALGPASGDGGAFTSATASSDACSGSPLLLPKQQMRRLSDNSESPSVTFAPLGPPADTIGSMTHALGGMRIGAGGALPPAF